MKLSFQEYKKVGDIMTKLSFDEAMKLVEHLFPSEVAAKKAREDPYGNAYLFDQTIPPLFGNGNRNASSSSMSAAEIAAERADLRRREQRQERLEELHRLEREYPSSWGR